MSATGAEIARKDGVPKPVADAAADLAAGLAADAGQGAPGLRPWTEVLSHLDPKYGGLSTVVPQLAAQVARHMQASAGVQEGSAARVRMAAFCAPGEVGWAAGASGPALEVSRWPISTVRWWRDQPMGARWDELVVGSEGLHIHGLWDTGARVAAQAARRLGVPYVMSAHGMLEPWALRNKGWKKRVYAALVERRNLEGAACLHALTQAEAEDYRRFGCKAPVAVIPNGVQVPAGVSPGAFQAAFPEVRGRRVVLFLGRLHFKKGLDLLIPAWAAVAARHPEALLVLAGPDAENSRGAVEADVARCGVGNRVLFTGMLRGEAKWSALAAAECFVLPSYSEGLSLATLEAMGVGVPVLITENCHLPEAAAAGAGWEIRATEAALTAALQEVLASTPVTNRERGERGRRLVAERYSWERVATQMSELYRWVQGGPRPASVQVQEAAR